MNKKLNEIDETLKILTKKREKLKKIKDSEESKLKKEAAKQMESLSGQSKHVDDAPNIKVEGIRRITKGARNALIRTLNFTIKSNQKLMNISGTKVNIESNSQGNQDSTNMNKQPKNLDEKSLCEIKECESQDINDNKANAKKNAVWEIINIETDNIVSANKKERDESQNININQGHMMINRDVEDMEII